ncbi:Ig-like domain-containing protein [Nitrospirillum iridis]|uniref:Nucleoid-associated protein YgaU n=1 Tax=Nitrospirillum iridis TaxID=765888 RepID=A0A7X0B225_9PROT|nr:nucleoid-associated protein YgaU [Nitrospirillum iridis]
MTQNKVIAAVVGVGALALLVWGLSHMQAERAANPAQKSAPATAEAPTGPSAVPTFDVVRVSPDGTVVIAGRAMPGAVVTVADGDTVLGTVTADKHGEWVLTPTQPLTAGSRTLSLKMKMADGTEVAADEAVTLVVPDAKRDVAGRKQNETGAALAVVTPRRGGSRVLQAPGKGDKSLTVAIDTVDYNRAGAVTVGGDAPPKAEVQLYVDNTLVGRATADLAGRWSITPERLLDPGRYTLRVDQVGTDGKVAARAEVTFERQPIADSDSRAVVVVPGNNLWTLARHLYGEGIQYTTIFEANQDQIRDANLIYPGQIFILPTTGGASPAKAQP